MYVYICVLVNVPVQYTHTPLHNAELKVFGIEVILGLGVTRYKARCNFMFMLILTVMEIDLIIQFNMNDSNTNL